MEILYLKKLKFIKTFGKKVSSEIPFRQFRHHRWITALFCCIHEYVALILVWFCKNLCIVHINRVWVVLFDLRKKTKLKGYCAGFINLPWMLNMCFFKCGSCEKATEVGTQSGMGHLNGFSPIFFCFKNYLIIF